MTTMYAGSTFERLPPNILDAILEYLDPRTLLNVGQVSAGCDLKAPVTTRLLTQVPDF
jgi:hypothetical protein